MPKAQRTMVDIIDSYTKAEEKIAIDLHGLCPNLDLSEIDTLAQLVFLMQLIEANTPLLCVRVYLQSCTEFTQDSKAYATLTGNKVKALEWIKGFILFLSEKDRARNKA